jgi:aspartate oxidase
MLASENQLRLKRKDCLHDKNRKETLLLNADGSNERPRLLRSHDIQNGKQIEQVMQRQNQEKKI